jgi:hypothetical protein
MKLDHIVILLGDLDAGLPFYATLLPLIGLVRLEAIRAAMAAAGSSRG